MDVNSASSSFSLATMTVIPPTSSLQVETAASASPSSLLFYHPTLTSEEHTEFMKGRRRRCTATDTTTDDQVFDGLHGIMNGTDKEEEEEEEEEETRDEPLTTTTWSPLAVIGPSPTSTFSDVENVDITLQPSLHHRSDYVVDLDKIDEGGGSDGLSEFSPPMSKEGGEKETTVDKNEQQPLQQFYDYRHRYYNEQYHYYDDKQFNSSSTGRGSSSNSIHSDMGSEVESTCSSITLSEAFAKSTDGSSEGDAMSATSSLTEGEYYLSSSRGRVGSNVSAYSPYYASSSSYTTPSMISNCSSVTLSRALGDDLDRHEHHDGGFYVATRLGDFVEDVPPIKKPPPPIIGQNFEDNDDVNYCEDSYGVTAIGDVDEENDLVDNNKNNAEEDDFFDSNSNNKGESADILDDILSDGGVANGYNGGSVAKVKVAGHHINIEMSSDILDLLPECGVPIPSVTAKAGVIRRLSNTRRQGGMLLPWHSTRSIQNYRGRKGGPKNGADGNSNRSLFSISSVHSFRG